MARRLLLVCVCLLIMAACGTDRSADKDDKDSGTDAGVVDAGITDAGTTDAVANDTGPAGCMPCVVGSSTAGNCCLQ